MVSVEVVVPLNVSGVWYPIRKPDPILTGSIGISLTLDPPLVAEVKESNEPRVLLNGEELKLNHLKILSSLGNLRLDITSPVGLGYGYGMSGAISLAYAFASTQIYRINLKKALDLAHTAEVLNETGLGDVTSEFYGGGIVYRKEPGSPSFAKVEVFKAEGKVCSKPLNALPTSAIIRDVPEALTLINEFLKAPSLVKFFEVSKKFSTHFGFIPEEDLTFRKKGLLLSLDRCGEGWIAHTIANHGAYVR